MADRQAGRSCALCGHTDADPRMEQLASLPPGQPGQAGQRRVRFWRCVNQNACSDRYQHKRRTAGGAR